MRTKPTLVSYSENLDASDRAAPLNILGNVFLLHSEQLNAKIINMQKCYSDKV